MSIFTSCCGWSEFDALTITLVADPRNAHLCRWYYGTAKSWVKIFTVHGLHLSCPLFPMNQWYWLGMVRICPEIRRSGCELNSGSAELAKLALLCIFVFARRDSNASHWIRCWWRMQHLKHLGNAPSESKGSLSQGLWSKSQAVAWVWVIECNSWG